MSRRFIRLAAAAAAVALSLAACSSSSGGGGGSDGTDAAFPVTVTHAFGETTIESAPKRVVAWGWGSADAAIAMGIVPVAIPFQAYGGNSAGVLPWISEKLDSMGAKIPTVLPDGEEPPYEQIANAKPDIILAALSGITQEQYDLLSDIAPVVAYPGEAWTTDWKEVITIVGKALGVPDKAKSLLSDIAAELAKQAAAHPEFKGKTIALASDTGGTFYIYKKADSRVSFTLDLGFVNAPAVDTLSSGDSTFFYSLSYEKLDLLKSDVLVNFAATQAESTAFLTAGYAQLMPQVKAGAVASPVGEAFVASVSPPTALSLTWGLDDYVAELSKAAKSAK
jgi:iron complex transport system substrate-binding protein